MPPRKSNTKAVAKKGYPPRLRYQMKGEDFHLHSIEDWRKMLLTIPDALLAQGFTHIKIADLYVLPTDKNGKDFSDWIKKQETQIIDNPPPCYADEYGV